MAGAVSDLTALLRHRIVPVVVPSELDTALLSPCS